MRDAHLRSKYVGRIEQTLLQGLRSVTFEGAELDVLLGALRPQATPPVQDWQPIETAPERPMQVEYYFGNLSTEYVIAPNRDCRRMLGYWDGEAWRDCSTGHNVPDYGEDDPAWTPTHWRPLPAPPLTQTDGKGQT
jgi:hypothetical protein